MQIQVNKELQQQKQDLEHCNNSFGMLLSSLESFFIKSGYNIRVLFGYYNHFNDISWKSLDEIKSQLYVDLMLYKMQKQAFLKKYRVVYLPDYPPIKDIINVIEEWKGMAKNKEEKKICDELLDLINDKNIKPMSYYYNKIEKIKPSSQVDPTKGIIMSNKIHNIMDKRAEEINEKILNNPDEKFGLKMGKELNSSEFSHLGNDIHMATKSLEQINFENEIRTKIKDLDSIIKNYEDNKKLNFKTIYDNISFVKESLKQNKDFEFLFQVINMDNFLKRLRKLIDKEKDSNNLDALESIQSLIVRLKNKINNS